MAQLRTFMKAYNRVIPEPYRQKYQGGIAAADRISATEQPEKAVADAHYIAEECVTTASRDHRIP